VKTQVMKLLEKCKLFNNIKPEEIQTLLSAVHYRVLKYEKNQLIAYQSTPCDELLILTKGIVNAEMTKLSGNSVKIAELHAPDSLAVAFLFGEQQFFPVDIVAQEEVTVLRIPKSSVLKMFVLNQQFLSNYLDMISTRAQYLTEKLKFFSFQTIKGKLAYFLLKTSSEQDSDTVIVRQTQNELAELFGVARPSLARCIKQLADDNCLEVHRREIKILNKRELASFLQYEDKLH